ncbi:hypothetical protein FJT64_008317 [Amphibalanus amphitrite]|uniref:Ig-like domain-containing protein n=1 Tax=Amphibalanus amphitrite TaxID=1232801 RepID=A0A6A4VLL2_AMPAM|nr:hypothetical protein FJT64_008317 [Amphibalanus amphitrite]
MIELAPARRRGVDGNDRADQIAQEAAALPQAAVPVDVATAHRAAVRLARDRTTAAWPEGWYRTLMGNRLPPPVAARNRSSAVDVHQLRAGHWSGSRQYLHRVGRNSSDDCRQCPDTDCTAGGCTVCREEADTSRHLFFRCPALMGWRLRSQLLVTTRQPALLTCHVTPPLAAGDIIWFKDGRRLPAAASQPALQLTGGNPSVAGMYQCHVTDDLATTQFTANRSDGSPSRF